MKVVFMGTPDFSVGTLEALVEAGYEITGVVTQPDKPKGRGKQMMPTPVKEAAEKHGLPVYQPRRCPTCSAASSCGGFHSAGPHNCSARRPHCRRPGHTV